MKCKRAFHLAIICTAILLGGILYLQFSKYTGFGLNCMFYRITGFYCSGCGITRMLQSIMGLKFYQALRYNPGVLIISPFLVYYFIIRSIYYIKGRAYRMSRAFSVLWIILAILFVIYGIMRNIPKFSYLAPTLVG